VLSSFTSVEGSTHTPSLTSARRTTAAAAAIDRAVGEERLAHDVEELTVHLDEVEERGERHVDLPMGRRVRLARPLGQRWVDAREQSRRAERADLRARRAQPVVSMEVREAHRAAVSEVRVTQPHAPQTCITAILSASVYLAMTRRASSGVVIAWSSMSRAMSLTHCV
jgi:hypothetical protein